MENFLFTISGSEIRGLEERLAQPLINNNPNSLKIGGLLILAVRESDNSVTKFKIFLVCWDTSSSIAKLVIPGLNRNLNEIQIDDELITMLNGIVPSPNIAMLERLGPFRSTPIQNNTIIIPHRWFKLAFLDKIIYDEMLTNNDFYHKIDNRYYTNVTVNSNGVVEPRTPVNTQERGLIFYAAMAMMYHGIVPSVPPALPDPGRFTTIMVRPNPEPVIVADNPTDIPVVSNPSGAVVGDNPSGAVAYVLIPSCPPYWKPSTQLIYSIPGLRFSANRAMQSAEPPEDNSQNKPSNWERLIWILIILILIFIATCKKI